MVQARYSFGYVDEFVYCLDLLNFLLHRYYGVILPCIFNLIGMCGFCILNSILGGQTLAAVADNNLSWTYVLFGKHTKLSACNVHLTVSGSLSLPSYHFLYVPISACWFNWIKFISCRSHSAAIKFLIGTNAWPGFPCLLYLSSPSV